MSKDVTEFLNEILGMSADQRRKATIIPRRRHPRENRPKFSRDELIRWALENKVGTASVLNKKRIPGKDPAYHDFIKEFGSWSVFKRELNPDTPEGNKVINEASIVLGDPPTDARYLASLPAIYGVWTRREYLVARRERPEIFPSIYHVCAQFGSWARFLYVAERMSLQKKVEKYIAWKDRRGRWPKMKDLANEKLDFSELFKHFGSKKKLERFLEELGEIREKRERDSRKA